MAEEVHPVTIWRRGQVERVRGVGRSTIYDEIAKGLMTKPVNIGARSVGWPAREVIALNEARIAGRSDDEIRALVSQLHADRERPSGAEVNHE